MTKKAFTLMEILLAVTIFSFAMVIVAGIFSSILGNQSSVSTNSTVNKESERILRQISDDTINALATGAVTNPGVATLNGSYKPRGILFLKDNTLVAEPKLNCQIDTAVNCDYDGVVLFSSKSIKIYRFDLAAKTIEYASDDTPVFNNGSPVLKIAAANKISGDYKFSTLNNDKVEIISSGFRGIGCYSAECNIAPFVKISFTTETKGYANKSARQRAKLEIKTLISGRSY